MAVILVAAVLGTNSRTTLAKSMDVNYVSHMANSGIVRVAVSTHRYLSNLTWDRPDFDK